MNNVTKKNTKSNASLKNTQAVLPPAAKEEETKVAPLTKPRSKTPRKTPGTPAGNSDGTKRAPSSKVIESEIVASKSPAVAGKAKSTSVNKKESSVKKRQAVT